MTVANTVTEQTYNGNGVNVTFAIPFTFISGETTVIKVYLIDNVGVETLQILTADYTLNDPLTPVNVLMNIAPAADEFLKVKRESPFTQPTDLLNNSPGHEESVEAQLDRNLMASQELDTKLTELENTVIGGTNTVLAVFPDWAGATDYIKDQVVVHTEKMYRATADHTSGTFSIDLVNNLWELLETSGIEGPAGIQGPQGAQGIQGPAGTNGLDGANGNDGIFSQIASTPEAEAGVDDTKGMTPLKTKEAITFQLPLHADIITMKANIATNTTDISALATRVLVLENQVQQTTGKFVGSQTLENGGVAIDLLGGDVANGVGHPLQRDGDGTEFADVMIYIKRKTDAGTRFSSFNLVFQYVDAVWYIARRETMQLEESLDLDGVVLTVTTDGGSKVGQVSYTADTMAGANHDVESVIKWLGQEISL